MTFGQPVFISIGDEYDKKEHRLPDRFKGKSFTSKPAKRGNGPDVTFGGRFVSLAEGDKYVDPGYYERRQRLENEKRKITPQGFRYSSGPKTTGGAGTYFGTFCDGKPYPHEVEYNPVRPGEKSESVRQATLKNMLAGQPKKPIGTDVKYISCPYDERMAANAANGRGGALQGATQADGKPFKAACKRAGFFDETAHGISKVFSIDKPLPAKKPGTGDRREPLSKAWRPGGSLSSVQTKPPPYMEDPYELKEKRAREERLAQRNEGKTAWRPIGGSKSLPTKSIKFTPA